jgi:S-adenosylmethionine:tRNA ribosyltransferase-isomerase
MPAPAASINNMVQTAHSHFSAVKLQDYLYHLPEESIARYPLAERDQSRLLVYNKEKIAHRKFRELPELLPANSLLFFNNTRVIPARMLFRKETGAQIELFLLQPQSPSTIMSEALSQTSRCSWQCMIGNLKRWKEDKPLSRSFQLNGQEVTISAALADRSKGIVSFSWEADNISFAELVEATGQIPLPPYLNREAEEADKPRYQTVYGHTAGAVAAPTAGLHFTEEVLKQIKQKGISIDYLTLHVSAGTFRPIKNKVEEHPMHCEQLIIHQRNLRELLAAEGPVVAVGTTSMRTLESLYWYGVHLLKKPDARFFVTKDEAYSYPEHELPSSKKAFEAILNRMEKEGIEELWGETEIFIVPGYRFRVCKGLVTNFHQPESTLILLVAAFVGPGWRNIYQEALEEKYRFLSYGDSSFLYPEQE